MTAGSFFTGRCLGQEARLHPHRAGELFDRELGVGGVVARLQRGAGRQVQLDQPGRRLRVHGGELDPEIVERGPQRADK